MSSESSEFGMLYCKLLLADENGETFEMAQYWNQILNLSLTEDQVKSL